jgi:cellobiose phosphorylase
MLNPIELTSSAADVARYKCEPYVLAGDVYSLEGHIGQGGWTWYTGASAWMYRIWIEEVLGFKLRGNVLSIDPTIPADWPRYTLSYIYGKSFYQITVVNPTHVGHGVTLVEYDGEQQRDNSIPLQDDGCEHTILIHMGHSQTAANASSDSISLESYQDPSLQ